MEKINPFAYLYYHLYLLQLEEYDLTRFWKTIIRTKGIPPLQLRKELVWTQKMKLLAVISTCLVGLLMVFPSVIFIFLFYISFVPITLAVIMLSPLDSFLKKARINKAKQILAQYPHLKVVGIAGSYGKTTMKEAANAILEQKYVVLKTPENINTPLGIADLVIKKLDGKIEVFIVEMGEYKRNDISEICSMVKPQTAIITGINEAHLERMGTIANTTATIFEIAEHMDQKGLLVLNGDNEHVVKNYKKFITTQKVELVSSKNDPHLHSGLLGRYARGVLQAGATIAKHLGLTDEQIRLGALSIKPLPHRLEPINGAQGVLIIDDSYNGNPEGVKEAIYLLSTYAKRRKVYITPGLVETGEKTEVIHKEIGKELSTVADLVVLIKNSATPFIAVGLLKNGFKEKNIRWYETAAAAHADMGSIVEPNDVVLFQNDWPDNYK